MEKRLRELTNNELIRKIDDDAIAREVSRRFLNYEVGVSDTVDALERRIMKLQGVEI
jgi:hypothetical protein